jgi:hypothetical protein
MSDVTFTLANELAEFFEQAAKFREVKAEEYPDDLRNEDSAKTLWKLAEYVRWALSDDDLRLDFMENVPWWNHIPYPWRGIGQHAIRIGFGYEVNDLHSELTLFLGQARSELDRQAEYEDSETSGDDAT